MEERMIAYLQGMLDKFKAMEKKNEEKAGYYRESEMHEMLIEMIACKEMVEVMIGMPVNLQKDGKVTVGF